MNDRNEKSNGTALMVQTQSAVELLRQLDPMVLNALRGSIFPGAMDESIALAVSYCKARGLDIMKKPVHLVPMWVKQKTRRPDGQINEVGGMRDVVMPGITLYRIEAERSGLHCGTDEPIFGPDKVMKLEKGQELTFPEWCKVTVWKRMPTGEMRGYTSNERWLENYATDGRDSTFPNSMWRKRPFAQLAKCAEAQALRKAFPDTLGGEPTAEEMEGKEVVIDVTADSLAATTGPQDVKPSRSEKLAQAASGRNSQAQAQAQTSQPSQTAPSQSRPQPETTQAQSQSAPVQNGKPLEARIHEAKASEMPAIVQEILSQQETDVKGAGQNWIRLIGRVQQFVEYDKTKAETKQRLIQMIEEAQVAIVAALADKAINPLKKLGIKVELPKPEEQEPAPTPRNESLEEDDLAADGGEFWPDDRQPLQQSQVTQAPELSRTDLFVQRIEAATSLDDVVGLQREFGNGDWIQTERVRIAKAIGDAKLRIAKK